MNSAERTAIGAEAALFSELFHRGRFVVPWHQRYYDWTEEDVRALLLDIEEAVRDERRCYFVGAVILVGLEDGTWEINDGQQRMVTVSLICAALCRRFAEETQDSQREALALRMLFDLRSDGVWSLEHAENYTPRIDPPRNDSVRYKRMIRGHTIGTNGNLTSAWRTIDEFLGATNEGSRWEGYFDYIREHLEVACLTVPQEIDPNAVFETINCRGKPLDDLDLIRNFIYSHFNGPNEVQRRVTVHENLERIREVFPSAKTANKAEGYVRCRMQCQFGFLSRDTFYRDLRRTVREAAARPKWRSRPNDLVFELSEEMSRPEDLELFRRLTVPTAGPEFIQDFEAKSRTTTSPRNLTVFLRELKGYSVTQTLVFALMVKYVHEADGRKKPKVAKLVNRNLSRLATFVIRTAFVAPKFEPSHFDRHFSDFAAEISRSKAVPDAEFAEFLRERDRLEHNVLDDGKFETFMATAQMRGNQKIKALLLGINRIGRPDAVLLNEAHCSVEHILPGGEEHWKGWPEFAPAGQRDWIHRIGNLTLMAKGDNKPGGKFNGSFARKIEVYQDSSVAITREIAGRSSWSPGEIEDRQREVAKQAVAVWSFA